MATYSPPPVPQVVDVRYDALSYGSGVFPGVPTGIHGKELQELRRSILEIRFGQEQRGERLVRGTIESGHLGATFNRVPAKRHYTVNVAFNHRGRGRPARFDLDEE